MGYEVFVSEKMHIAVCDKTSALLAKSLGYYIDNFFTSYWISELEIESAVLTVDGETVELHDVRSRGGKVTYRASSGKGRGKTVALTDKPCEYYGFRNMARQNLPYAKEVSFSVRYYANCFFGADVGIGNLIGTLTALDCPCLRAAVVYKAFQESHPGEGFEVYRYDRDFQGYDPVCRDISIVGSVNGWEIDGNAHIYCGEQNAAARREITCRAAAQIRPLLKKYGFALGECDYDAGEINIENTVTVSSGRLEEFFCDFQKFLDILSAGKMELAAYTEGLISTDTRRPGIIRLSVDCCGTLHKTYNIA